MAGSFGFEAEHYDISMQIGKQRLFPAIWDTPRHATIVAPGVSCRQQIAEGTGRKAVHPAELMYRAMLRAEQGSAERGSAEQGSAEQGIEKEMEGEKA